MEDQCPPVKRRKVLQEHETEHLEFNKDSNASTNVFPNDEKGVLINGSQIDQTDQIDPEQESIEGKTDIIMEELVMETEPKMDTVVSLTNSDETKQSGSKVKIEDNLSTKISESCGHNGHSHSRKKLLVLDVNGLLVDIVLYPDQSYKADTFLGAKAVFKRPYCDEFLKFCFEKFDVGIWTSRTRRNIERVLEFLMKDTQQQLLFCWDQSHCTETGFSTIDNSDKPLVLKELKKLWEKEDPNLPWDKGVYDKSNTLLLDDSPYKALRNPPYTAIFPYSYTYRRTKDKGLGPGGDLRNYLEKLAASSNVQTFVKQNPFGQPPITYKDKLWKFYQKIIASPLLSKPELSRRKLLIIDASGLLIDIASLSSDRFRAANKAEGFRADTIQGSKAVFKRPYCDEFLNFCFERFNVGVWSSTTSYNTERILDFLMGDNQHKLLFCWDQSRCTDTGYHTVESSSKPLVLKELRRLWEKQDLDLPWEIGEYDESNTLLLENTPYKALLNPPHTAIFPYPYRYWKTDDNSLGPTGDLRVYLERLVASENVQKFVEENPFGQRPIREKNLSWGFYRKIIRAFSSEPESSVEAHCKTSFERKTVSTGVSVTQPTLSEPKTDSTTAPNTISSSVSVSQPTLLEPNTDTTMAPNTVSSSVSVTPILLEPKTDSITAPNTISSSVSVTPSTLLEPKNNIVTASVSPTLLEPKTESSTAIALVTPTALEPKTESSTALVTPLREPKTDTSTLVTPTLLEPKTDTATASVSPTVLEPKTESSIATALVTPTVLELKTEPSTASLTPPREPKTETTTLVAPTLLEPKTNPVAMVPPTLLEPKNDTSTSLVSPTLVDPKNEANTASVAKTFVEPVPNSAKSAESELESGNNSSLEPN